MPMTIDTGYYVRIERDGKWQSLDIATLTDEELCAFFAGETASRCGAWAASLAGWIRDNVRELRDAEAGR